MNTLAVSFSIILYDLIIASCNIIENLLIQLNYFNKFKTVKTSHLQSRTSNTMLYSDVVLNFVPNSFKSKLHLQF